MACKKHGTKSKKGDVRSREAALYKSFDPTEDINCGEVKEVKDQYIVTQQFEVFEVSYIEDMKLMSHN